MKAETRAIGGPDPPGSHPIPEPTEDHPQYRRLSLGPVIPNPKSQIPSPETTFTTTRPGPEFSHGRSPYNAFHTFYDTIPQHGYAQSHFNIHALIDFIPLRIGYGPKNPEEL